MKKITFCLYLGLLLIGPTLIHADTATNGASCIDSSGVSSIITERTDPTTGYVSIKVASSNNSWIEEQVSNPLVLQNNFSPQLKTTKDGDLVAAWGFVTTTGSSGIQGAIKPVGSSIWTVTTVTNPTIDIFLTSFGLVLNNNGEMSLSWTTYTPDLQTKLNRVATGTVSGGWNPAITVTP